MQNLLEHTVHRPQNPLAVLPDSGTRRAVLDLLDDAVVQLDIRGSKVVVSKANSAAAGMGLVNRIAAGEGECFDSPSGWFVELAGKIGRRFQFLSPPGNKGRSEPPVIEHRCFEPSANRHLRLKFFRQDWTDDELSMVCVARTEDPLLARTNYLEKRAVKLIAHANNLEASRLAMEQQINALKNQVKSLEKTARFDEATGLPSRAQFMERSAAELQRCRRYGHPMALVVAEILGLEETMDISGPPAGKLAIAGFAQICESAFRLGVDLAGRLDDKRIGILLPETDLNGALLFADRLRDLIAQTPLKVDGALVYLGTKLCADAAQDEDQSIRDMFDRIALTM